MTALARYARLEAPGRYFDGHSAGPLPVFVSFGAHTLVIMDYDGVAVAHWPLGTLRATGERGDAVVQLRPDAQSDERLVIEEPEMIRAIEAVCPDLRHRPADRRGVRRAVVWGAGAAGAVLLLVFAILPGLAGQLAQMIPPERERQLGDAVVGQLQQVLGFGGSGRPGFCADPQGLAALERMTGRLAATVSLPYPLRVAVLDHPMSNAVAVPGGRILVFRGLIEEAASPEEVAGVLAHEIGHVLYRDPTVSVLRSAGTAGILGMMVGDVFGAAVVVAATEALLDASYRQDVEARADETATRMLADAGLPSAPFAAFFARMAGQAGEPGVLQYLASHPRLDERAEKAAAADRVGDAPFEPALSDTDWVALRQICRRREAGPPG